MSLRLRLLNAVLRRVEKRKLARAADPVAARARFEHQARLVFRMPPDIAVTGRAIGGVRCAFVRHAAASGDGIILHLPGGAFIMGSPETHQAMLAALSARIGLPAILPAYRKAPENRHPAALEDCMAVYQGLLARGYAAERIVLGGDSAGGLLTFLLLARLQARGLPAPGFVYGLSPFTDFSASGPSYSENAGRDPFLPVERLPEIRAWYLGDADPADPDASPLFAQFAPGPRVWLTVGSTEILRDDSLHLHGRLRARGVDATLEIARATPHVWPIFQGWLPEADATLDRLAAAIRAASGVSDFL